VQVHIPHFSLIQPIVGLVGTEQPLELAPGWLEQRVLYRPLQQELVGLRLNSDLALFGGFLTNETGLARLAGQGPLNTDDHPLVTYRAPAFAYEQREAHGERLVELVTGLRSGGDPAATLLAPPVSSGDTDFAGRAARYWAARDAYLEAGLAVTPGTDTQAMLAQVGGPLLEVVRISSDFEPAYGALLNMAIELYAVNPTAARELVEALIQAAPDRLDARRLLEQM
jgi:spermidine synthase